MSENDHTDDEQQDSTARPAEDLAVTGSIAEGAQEGGKRVARGLVDEQDGDLSDLDRVEAALEQAETEHEGLLEDIQSYREAAQKYEFAVEVLRHVANDRLAVEEGGAEIVDDLDEEATESEDGD